MSTFVSIVVPVYNVEKWLSKCIDSILAQSYKNFELILVNDGTPDSSGEICKEYAKKDKRIKVINKMNGGVSSAKNIGIKAAIGEYIFFVDSDDFVKPNMCMEVIDKIEKHSPDIIMFGYELLLSGERRIPVFEKGYLDEPLNVVSKSTNPHTRNDFSFTWRFVFRNSFIKEHNILFDEDIKIGEDALFNMESIYKSSSMFVIDKSLYIYNDSNTDSAMRKKYKKNFHIELDNQYIKKIKLIKEFKIEDIAFIEDLHSYYIRVLILNSIRNLCNGNLKNMYSEVKKLLNLQMCKDSFQYFSLKKLYHISDSVIFFVFLCMCKYRFSFGAYAFIRKFYIS